MDTNKERKKERKKELNKERKNERKKELNKERKNERKKEVCECKEIGCVCVFVLLMEMRYWLPHFLPDISIFKITRDR